MEISTNKAAAAQAYPLQKLGSVLTLANINNCCKFSNNIVREYRLWPQEAFEICVGAVNESVFTRFFRSSAQNIYIIIRTVAANCAPSLLAADTAWVSRKTDHRSIDLNYWLHNIFEYILLSTLAHITTWEFTKKNISWNIGPHGWHVTVVFIIFLFCCARRVQYF